MRWRKQARKPTSPNFLFSLPPYIEEGFKVPTVIVTPTGGDDTPHLQAAINRLWAAAGGGVLRLSAGHYYGNGGTIYLDDRYE